LFKLKSYNSGRSQADGNLKIIYIDSTKTLSAAIKLFALFVARVWEPEWHCSAKQRTGGLKEFSILITFQLSLN